MMNDAQRARLKDLEEKLQGLENTLKQSAEKKKHWKISLNRKFNI